MEKIRVFMDPSELGHFIQELRNVCPAKSTFRGWRGGKKVPINFIRKFLGENFWEFLDKKRIISYGHHESILFDKGIDTDISYFLGWLITDGHIRKGRGCVTITQKFREPLEKLKNILIKKYSIKEDHFKLKFDRHEWRLEIYSSPLKYVLVEYFKIPAGMKHSTARVPQQILESNEMNKFAFVCGVIEGDGHVGASNEWKGYRYPKVEIIMKNEKFLIDIENILDSIGIYHTKFKYSDGMFCVGIKKAESFKRLYENIKNSLTHPKKIEAFSGLINQNIVENLTVK